MRNDLNLSIYRCRSASGKCQSANVLHRHSSDCRALQHGDHWQYHRRSRI